MILLQIYEQNAGRLMFDLGTLQVEAFLSSNWAPAQRNQGCNRL